MPELISEGSVKKPLLVGAADPYEFIAEHAVDRPTGRTCRAKRQGFVTTRSWPTEHERRRPRLAPSPARRKACWPKTTGDR